MSIADKKSTHHHHHQSVAGHDHHHQTDLSSERERGPDDSDEEGGLWPAINISPSHFDHNSLPKVPGSWHIGRLATGRIYLVAARHGKGRGEGREGGRESEGRGRVRFRVVLSLSLFFLEGGFLAFTVFCFSVFVVLVS